MPILIIETGLKFFLFANLLIDQISNESNNVLIQCSNHIIPPLSGSAFEVKSDQYIKVIDVLGKQVADFIAINSNNKNEFLSMGATIDQNNSLKLIKGDFLFSNYYNLMLEVADDTVGTHDMIHPMCRPEMYARQYGAVTDHASCFNNIQQAMRLKGIAFDEPPNPLNIFMYTQISAGGDLSVQEPLSKQGDFILFKAKMDLIVGVAACSVQESKCNGSECSQIDIQIFEDN